MFHTPHARHNLVNGEVDGHASLLTCMLCKERKEKAIKIKVSINMKSISIHSSGSIYLIVGRSEKVYDHSLLLTRVYVNGNN